MAYVLGFIYADGSLEYTPKIRGKYLRITNTDRARLSAIRSLLQASHPIQVHATGNRERKRCYLLRIGSHTLFDSLATLGLTPRKSLTMQFPAVPQKFFSAFVRGYFDGDGCVHLETRAGAVTRMRVIFTSGSRAFLTVLSTHLERHIRTAHVPVRAATRPHRATTFQVRLSTRDSMRLYCLMYPEGLPRQLYLPRKYAIFNRYFRLRGIRRRDIPRIVKQHGPVVKG